MNHKYLSALILLLPINVLAQDVEWKDHMPDLVITDKKEQRAEHTINPTHLITSEGLSKIKTPMQDGEGNIVPVNTSVRLLNNNSSILANDIKLLAFSLKIQLSLKNSYSFKPKSISIDVEDNEGQITLYYTAENSYGGTVSNSISRYIVKKGNNFIIER